MSFIAKQSPSNGWKKGQSGNPKGRAKTAKCIPDILRRIGDEQPTDFMLASLRKIYGPAHRPCNMREAMLLATYADAAKGDAVARAFIAERTEGKVTDQIQLEGDSKVIHEHSFDFAKMDVTDIERLRAMIAKATKD